MHRMTAFKCLNPTGGAPQGRQLEADWRKGNDNCADKQIIGVSYTITASSHSSFALQLPDLI
jgi:hypothetical protein